MSWDWSYFLAVCALLVGIGAWQGRGLTPYILERRERRAAAHVVERESVLAFIELLECYIRQCNKHCVANMEAEYYGDDSVPYNSIPDPDGILTFTREQVPERIKLFIVDFKELAARLKEEARNDTHCERGRFDPHDIVAHLKYYRSHIGYAGYIIWEQSWKLRRDYDMPVDSRLRPDIRASLLKQEYERYCKIHPITPLQKFKRSLWESRNNLQYRLWNWKRKSRQVRGQDSFQ
jgi:hypothetical protein